MSGRKSKYTEEDIAFLKEHYPIGDFDAIFKRFPSMSKQNIISLCHRHDISADYYNNKKWTKEELKIVEDYYYTKSIEEIYRMLNERHTYDAIQTKALKRFGYSKDRTWTSEELNILRAYYPIESVDEVRNRLPKRTRAAIIRQANNLGIFNSFTLNTYWNKHDEKLLIDNWETMSDFELSKLIGKDKRSISQKRWMLGLTKVKHYNEASYENIIKYIRGNIGVWKSDSMKNCSYQCVLTGSKDFQVHHVYSLSMIFNEVIEENDIVLKDDFSDYSEKELSFILSKFIEKQNKYPLGVCVRKDLHMLFHKIYGQKVLPEMWNNFVDDYNNGKYINKIG